MMKNKTILLSLLVVLFIGCVEPASNETKNAISTDSKQDRTSSNSISHSTDEPSPNSSDEDPFEKYNRPYRSGFQYLEIVRTKEQLIASGEGWKKKVRIPIKSNLKHLTIKKIELVTYPDHRGSLGEVHCPIITETFNVTIPPGKTRYVDLIVNDKNCEINYYMCLDRRISKVELSSGEIIENGDLSPELLNDNLKYRDEH